MNDDAIFEMQGLIYRAQEEFDQQHAMTQRFQTIPGELKKFQTVDNSGDIVPAEYRDEDSMALAAKMQLSRLPVLHLL